MVEAAKKEQEEKRAAQQQLEKKQKAEEEKIAKHIQDYQRALLKQQEQQSKLPAQVAPLRETTASNDVVNLLKKHSTQTSLDAKHIDQLVSAAAAAQAAQDAAVAAAAASAAAASEPTSSSNSAAAVAAVAAATDMNGSAARRRRGRPPKNSNVDLTYSPPEKRSRASVDSVGSGILGEVVDTTTGLMANGDEVNGIGTRVTSVPTPKSSGGKGIRNRVFCGECSGCLKNDDCGRCRYRMRRAPSINE